ncbi:MAG: SpoIIE family protein phosphatase [Clostridiales bacterium]|nr:SpoIIE family protein phosphatase [Clostridiales bacterium]
MIVTKPLDWPRHKKYHIFLGLIVVLSSLLFVAAFLLKEEFTRVVSVDGYLAWHNVLELASILVSFTIFVVAFYSYEETQRFKTILSGCLLLAVCELDVFHMLSFKGMPDFFGANITANRATTLWVIARMAAAAGFLIVSLIQPEMETRFKRWTFTLPAILLPIAAFAVVSYRPDLIPAMYLEGYGITHLKRDLELMIILIMLISAVLFYISYIKTNEYNTLLYCGAMLVGIFAEISFINYYSVYDIYNFMGHIFKGITYFMLFKAILIRNIQMPYIDLYNTQKELRNYADNLDRLVTLKTRQLKRINSKLVEDLEYARDIQKAMLPAAMLNYQDVLFYSVYMPAERLSGDFFDIFKIDEQHVGFYISDVSGHGVPAAMLTVYLKQCIEARKAFDKNSDLISFPSVVMRSLFESFNHANFKDETYFVVIYAIYNTSTRRLIYCSAGMNAPPVIIKANGEVSEVMIKGLPICRIKDIYEVEYMDTFLDLGKGDKILFYTDGLVDAENMERQKFSEKRLYKLLTDYRSESGEKVIMRLSEEFNEFVEGKKINDDVTYFLMEIN